MIYSEAVQFFSFSFKIWFNFFLLALGPPLLSPQLMCKHIINATVSLRSPCCLKWFACSECHDTYMDHPVGRDTVILFACLACNKSFRKDLAIFGDRDELCPHCEERYVLPAVTPELMLLEEMGDYLSQTIDLVTDPQKTIKTASELELWLPTMVEENKELFTVEIDPNEVGLRQKAAARKNKLLQAKKGKRATTKKSVESSSGDSPEKG